MKPFPIPTPEGQKPLRPQEKFGRSGKCSLRFALREKNFLSTHNFTFISIYLRTGGFCDGVVSLADGRLVVVKRVSLFLGAGEVLGCCVAGWEGIGVERGLDVGRAVDDLGREVNVGTAVDVDLGRGIDVGTALDVDVAVVLDDNEVLGLALCVGGVTRGWKCRVVNVGRVVGLDLGRESRRSAIIYKNK